MVFPFPYPYSSRWLSGRVSFQRCVCRGTAECPLLLRPHRVWRHLPAHVRQRWPYLRQRLHTTKSGVSDQDPHPHQATGALWWVVLKEDTGSGSFCVHRSPLVFFCFFIFYFCNPPVVSCLYFKEMWFPPPSAVSRLSVCLFLTWNVSEVAQRCALNGCVRAGGWAGGRGEGEHLKATWRACLPWKNCAFTSPLVHLPSISSSQSCIIP